MAALMYRKSEKNRRMDKIFQSPFSGDLDCEILKSMRTELACILNSFNPRFQGISIARTHPAFEDFRALEKITFNPRFQGISIVRRLDLPVLGVPRSATFNPRFQGISIVRLHRLRRKWLPIIPFNPRFQGMSIASCEILDNRPMPRGLSIPVFRGCRLRVNYSRGSTGPIRHSTFNPRFQGMSIARTLK